jgi:hypothetical protein
MSNNLLKPIDLESSLDESKAQKEPLSPLLPRSAWTSQVAFLRVLFRAKKALDQIEKEAGVVRN